MYAGGWCLLAPCPSTKNSPPESEADMAYAERRDSAKGPRYRGFYKGTDGRYKSAGTYDTEQRALEISQAAEKHAAELVGGPGGGLDPVLRAARTIGEYAPVFLRHHRVEGN